MSCPSLVPFVSVSLPLAACAPSTPSATPSWTSRWAADCWRRSRRARPSTRSTTARSTCTRWAAQAWQAVHCARAQALHPRLVWWSCVWPCLSAQRCGVGACRPIRPAALPWRSLLGHTPWSSACVQARHQAHSPGRTIPGPARTTPGPHLPVQEAGPGCQGGGGAPRRRQVLHKVRRAAGPLGQLGQLNAERRRGDAGVGIGGEAETVRGGTLVSGGGVEELGWRHSAAPRRSSLSLGPPTGLVHKHLTAVPAPSVVQLQVHRLHRRARAGRAPRLLAGAGRGDGQGGGAGPAGTGCYSFPCWCFTFT
jgi:hypothetical protein